MGVANANTDTGDGESWSIKRMIFWSAEYLDSKGVENARLDAEWLLAEALDMDRLEMYLQYDRLLDSVEKSAFKSLLLRRAAREPLQYILGNTSFRELDLLTDIRVLIPRQETEILVESVLSWGSEKEEGLGRVLDLGTGSGAIGISLALEGECSQVVATDVKSDALAVAIINAKRNGVKDLMEFRLGSLFEPIKSDDKFQVIVSNPPYIPDSEVGLLQPEVVDWEPTEALFGGKSGMEIMKEIIIGAPKNLTSKGLLALECGLGQSKQVASEIEATETFGEVMIHRDLTGRERVVTAERN
ncbi:MAG TPA: peptide chain release factor N(5)-glutamine methyltransferase [Gemmatimonadetes bacterium]|nr:peptide chain release factor N(5)-glutamine methyltransferase [Gemmatimonadota bacterium]